MIRGFGIAVVVLALFRATGFAYAETWTGCVGVANTSGTNVTVTVDSYPEWSWQILASDTGIKYLRTNDQTVIMTADRKDRPPIHVQPSNVGIAWNFFIGEHDPQNSCTNAWRIVIIQSPCSAVVDNICQ